MQRNNAYQSCDINQHNDSTKIMKSNEESKNLSEVLNSDGNSHQFISRNKGTTPKSSKILQGIRLNFKGNKNMKEKGKYSEVPHVLNKNLMRCIRRYLKELYGLEKIKIIGTRFTKKKIDSLKLFYEKCMKSHSQ